MWGTIVNVIAVVIGGSIGLLLKEKLRENLRSILDQAVSMAVVFVGISSGMRNLLDKDAHPMLFIIALAVGGLVGELIGVEKGLARLGNWLQEKFKNNPKLGDLSSTFVTASILFCAGTMSVLGSIESGVQGQYNILYAKSMIDGIIGMVLASTMGAGVIFAAGTVLVYQGVLTLLAGLIGPGLTVDMIREIGIIGGVLITSIGLNMLGLTKIRVGNLIPALLVPVIYYAVLGLVK